MHQRLASDIENYRATEDESPSRQSQSRRQSSDYSRFPLPHHGLLPNCLILATRLYIYQKQINGTALSIRSEVRKIQVGSGSLPAPRFRPPGGSLLLPNPPLNSLCRPGRFHTIELCCLCRALRCTVCTTKASASISLVK